MSRVQAPAAEEMLDRVACSRERFSFQMCLESGDGGGTEGTDLPARNTLVQLLALCVHRS